MLVSLERQGGGEELAGRLQLTSLDGGADALLELSGRLHESTPLRLSARQDGAAVFTCDPADLDPESATDAVLAQILRGCQAQLLSLHGAAVDDLDPVAVHQTRVGLRRLRAALGLFKPLLPPSLSARLNDEARWLGSMLAPVRDWDVYLEESLAQFRASTPDDPGLLELIRRAVAARAQSASAMRAALTSKRPLAFYIDLEFAIERRVWRDQSITETTVGLFAPICVVAPQLLDRLWRGVRKEAKGMRTGGPEARHELRKRIKKLRYSVEFVQCIGSKRDVKQFLSELSELQQRLGVANDVRVAEDLTAQLLAREGSIALARAGGFICGWMAHAHETAPTDAADGWRRLRETPKFWRELIDA